ncbi:MAG: rRNA maturation RNase YbeY [Firmicutes bacterium]|nr:rRNA maturation RNase YbeY [Bacillota bacterium]MCL1953685.1 rRNA maturation RNase YbeY [Bacillota bacterium]
MIRCNIVEFDSICKATSEVLCISGDALFVDVDFVDEDTIHQINLQHRNVDKSTDVLSFGMLDITPTIKKFKVEDYQFEYSEHDNAILLGSIVICDSIAQKQAIEYGHSKDREMSYLFLHGLLHLLGYDHIIDSDKVIMRSVEKKIIGELEDLSTTKNNEQK